MSLSELPKMVVTLVGVGFKRAVPKNRIVDPKVLTSPIRLLALRLLENVPLRRIS